MEAEEKTIRTHLDCLHSGHVRNKGLVGAGIETVAGSIISAETMDTRYTFL